MYRYISGVIGNLAVQFKRGPTRLRLRQLHNIDFLLSVAEVGKSYPADFVMHALTGYRAPGGASARGDSALVTGAALRSDLVTLAEDISADANIQAACWPEPIWSVGELAKRFDVSTKTIFRWHRRGLIGWRFRFADRRVRLAFPERCVRQFVARNSELVARGSSFSQLTRGEREGIVERARVLFDAGEKTINAAAKVIARETGRAVETIRLILKHYDEAHPRAGIFNRSVLRLNGDDQRLRVWEAYNDGADLTSLAQRFDQPIAWVYQTLTHMRALALRARQVEYINDPGFSEPGVESEVLNGVDVAAPYGEVTPPKRIPADLPPYLQQLFRIPLLTPRGETALFRKMNYLKHRADVLRQQVDPETVSATELDRIEALLSDAQAVKNQITQSNLRLVVSIAKRHLTPGQDFFEIVSDGNMSLMRAIDKFDYTRGFKFSTYASWAIIKNYARAIPEARTHRDRYQTGREEVLEVAAGPRAPDEHENDHLLAVRGTVERMLHCLDEREQVILRQRYGLENGDQPQTLEQIGQRLGVSKERIRQLEARAVARLRQEFASEANRLLSG
jgi:RNA polymerase sigma factor (sigma-70 family)